MSLCRDDDDFPELYERVLAMVRKALRDDWDPLGVVADYPSCYDEYDAYAPGLASMLVNGVSEKTWAARRLQILSAMGHPPSPKLDEHKEFFALLRETAEKIAEEFYD